MFIPVIAEGKACDYQATAQYFFRYDNGVTNVHLKSALGRLFLGRVLGSDRLLRLAERLRRFRAIDRPDVTVDLLVPFSRLEPFMDWYEASIRHYPVWCVPYRRVRDYEWIAPGFLRGVDDPLFVDLALYGMKQPDGRNIYKDIEDRLPAFNAIKTLISYNYYDAATFWTIWNRPNYEAVKCSPIRTTCFAISTTRPVARPGAWTASPLPDVGSRSTGPDPPACYLVTRPRYRRLREERAVRRLRRRSYRPGRVRVRLGRWRHVPVPSRLRRVLRGGETPTRLEPPQHSTGRGNEERTAHDPMDCAVCLKHIAAGMGITAWARRRCTSNA
jgi:hypothetical protein